MIRSALLVAICCSTLACRGGPPDDDADVIVIGAGIAGLSAALEASAAGARVLVIERSSVPGGHAVRAGGFAFVDTPLQRARGHHDNPDLARAELMAWGEDANADWVRYYVEHSRADIHDWLADLGVEFNILLATPEGSVPRFHFAGGTAVNVIVPMLKEAYTRDTLRWSLNSRAEALERTADGALIVRVRNVRSGAGASFRAPAVILSTGGFQGNLDMVRRNWPANVAPPARLLLGASPHATGDGIRLGKSIGADVERIEAQVTLVNGLPDPRSPGRGLHVTNRAAIWVDARGIRFVNEAASPKVTDAAALALTPHTHWLVFDARGRRKLRVRDAAWLDAESIGSEILANPDVAAEADTISGLARKIGLPPGELSATIERYNRFVEQGIDEDYQRFADPGRGEPLATPPYYALQVFPMTRKNLGGLRLDMRARTLGPDGKPVAGLFAAGEVTGVAGINGSHGGSGTFLAPSVLTGRIAGAAAAAYADRSGNGGAGSATPTETLAVVAAAPLPAADLGTLLSGERAGYWHFETSHRLVLERGLTCNRCHTEDWPTGPAVTSAARIAQLDSCRTCH